MPPADNLGSWAGKFGHFVLGWWQGASWPASSNTLSDTCYAVLRLLQHILTSLTHELWCLCGSHTSWIVHCIRSQHTRCPLHIDPCSHEQYQTTLL